MFLFPYYCVIADIFDLDRSNACSNVQKLTSILEKVLGKKMVLPKRKISTLEELFEIFPEAKDIFIDGTERPIQRPKDNEKQKENYSGKKKKPRGKELNDEEKAQNKVISGLRVLVEHAIGGIKRFKITTDKFRNKKDKFNDEVILISCGLWNYHLKCC